MTKVSKYKFIIIFFVLTGAGCYYLLQAHADSLTATINISGNCVSSVNGTSTSSVSVAAGSTTLTVDNAYFIAGQSISGPGVPAGTIVERNSRETNGTIAISLGVVSAPITITFTPIPTDYTNPGIDNNYCPLGSNPTPSYLIINPVATPTQPAAPVQKAPAKQSKTQTTTPTATPQAEQTPPSSTVATPSTPTQSDSPKRADNGVAEIRVSKNNMKSPFITLGALLAIGLTAIGYMNRMPIRKSLLAVRRKLKL